MALSSRQLALQILRRIEEDDAYSHIVISSTLSSSELDERDRHLVTELVYGTLTHQRTIDTVIAPFLKRPLQGLDLPVRLALRLALYQLIYLDRIPAHAIVDEAVNMTKAELGKGASGFVNGVLRQMLRKRENWRPYDPEDRKRQPLRYLAERYSLPDWIARRLLAMEEMERAEALAQAFNQRPPLYLQNLATEASELPDNVDPVPGVPRALRAKSFDQSVRQGLADHRWIVQDLGSQLICHFVEPRGATQLLDGCAGLGGKTLHLAISTDAAAHIDAVEPLATKLAMLEEVLADTPAKGRVALHTSTLQDFLAKRELLYDRILIDAPCTGLGILRRHPETRWRRKESDIAPLVKLQRSLLDCAARHLRPGGILIYSVCTFLDEEGPGQVEKFLNENNDFQRWKPTSRPPSHSIEWGPYTDPEGDLRLTPLDHDCDAFYAARLIRKTDQTS